MLHSRVGGVRTGPVVAGAVAGLVVGTLGLVPQLVFDAADWTGLLPLLGAVAGGGSAAYLSAEGLGTDVGVALLADVASSAIFFVVGTLGVAGWMSYDDGHGLAGAALLAPYGFLVGAFVAVPVGAVSLLIAGLSGAAVSLLVTTEHRTTFTPRDREK